MKVKKYLLSLLMVFLIALAVSQPIYASEAINDPKSIILKINNPWMYVNEDILEVDPGIGTSPVIHKGRTLLPVKSISEELGGSVKWEAKAKKVSIHFNNRNINLWINKKTASVNGEQVVLDVAPTVMNGRTMLPLRFISENLGLTLVWDKYNQVIALYYGEFDYIPTDYSGYFLYEEPSFNDNKALTSDNAMKLVESLDPGNFTAFYEPEYDIETVDSAYYFYINYSAANGMGGDVFVMKGVGEIYGVMYGTETDPEAPFPDFSNRIK